MTIQASGRVHLIIIKAMGGGSFMGAQILSVSQIPDTRGMHAFDSSGNTQHGKVNSCGQ
jgi:hypothetical protein